MEAPSNFFSVDYRTARNRFREAAKAIDARRSKLFWGMRGPHGEKLTIDVALIGDRKASNVLLHSSGIHGVEGFAGSAIQLQLLHSPPRIPPNCALVLVHCLNPYGMAYLRRANEHNVDLNRNFVNPESDKRVGAHRGYHLLHGLLNPASPPRFDFFSLRLMYSIVRYGYHYLKQAGAEGQYEYPRGLFFGGRKLEMGPRLFVEWLKKNLRSAKRLCAIDVHTGIGEPGTDWLILERNRQGPYHAMLEQYYPDRMDTYDGSKTSIVYTIRGGVDVGVERALPAAHIDFITQEFGTVSGLRLLHALRQENRSHHHRGNDPSDPAKLALRECFSPPSDEWRQGVLRNGRFVVELTTDYLFHGRRATVSKKTDR